MIHNTATIDPKAKISSNVKIGPYCVVGPNVEIGDEVILQSHVHVLGKTKIGNNVDIAGGSGVIKDIPDNSRVMGYPAKNLREFLRENK